MNVRRFRRVHLFFLLTHAVVELLENVHLLVISTVVVARADEGVTITDHRRRPPNLRLVELPIQRRCLIQVTYVDGPLDEGLQQIILGVVYSFLNFFRSLLLLRARMEEVLASSSSSSSS
jgi:hypothetical protein